MIEKKVIGEHSCLYVQKSWGRNVWTELADTSSFIRMLEDQMVTTNRVNQRKELCVKLAFGRAKSGFEFEDMSSFQTYIGLDGDAIDYSQECDTHLPLETQHGAALRKGIWRSVGKIADLVQFMYTDVSCKLFYGFTKEHANSFFRIINVNVNTLKDASPFLPYISSTINKSPPANIIEEHLLVVFTNCHSSDAFGSLPLMNKYPPTNEDMCRVPPKYCDWKKTEMESTFVTPVDNHTVRLANVNQHVGVRTQLCDSDGRFERCVDDEVLVLKFVYEREETCVLINGQLTHQSTIERVMVVGEVLEDFNLIIDELDDYKYLIKTKGNGFRLKWKQVNSMTVETLIKLKNIDTEYSIAIVAK